MSVLMLTKILNFLDSFGNTMSKELQPTASIEKIQRLEVENKALREGQGGQTALMVCSVQLFYNFILIIKFLLQQLLDDANKRNENLREQLKYANERILSLTHATQSDDPNIKEYAILFLYLCI